MDTISRENNSMLPVAGVVVGVVALILGGIALIKGSSLQKQVSAHDAQVAKIDGIEQQVTAAAATADKATRDLSSLSRTTQDAFNTVSTMIGDANGKIAKLEDSMKKPVAAKGAKSGEPVVAGPGEYVIKGGDTGAKIARSQGFALADLIAVNPDVNWSKLKVGQKVKVPQKK